MTAGEARKLIGKRVFWEEVDSRYVYEHSAVFLEVAGRNVRTDDFDWKWLPSIGRVVRVEDVA